MKFTIAQIGKNRLKKVLVEDKQSNPEKLCALLKCDVLNVAKSYLDNANVEIVLSQVENKVVFNLTINCDRVKSFGVLA